MEGEDGRVATDERRHSLGLSIVTSINFERVYAAHVHSSPLSMPIWTNDVKDELADNKAKKYFL